jgi:1,2-phenylacetyl-CoA epoxidase catalytic subunit
MARFLFDRAGYWQLREYANCVYAPYAELARAIAADEAGHLEEGERVVVDLARAAPDSRQVQWTFDRWLRPALLSFGRPGSADSRAAIAAGLKQRDPGDVIESFFDDIRPGMKAAGLRLFQATLTGLQLPASLALRGLSGVT